MKKRILSFILVACMLLTMLPIMASAEEAAEAVASNVESTNADYAELYVQSGLVHAYMAFGTSDASYDIAQGVWYDLVGSANATINGGAYSDSNLNGWKVGESGGLSYEDAAYASSSKSITWSVGTGEGQLNLPSTFNVEYVGSTTFRDVVMPLTAATVTSAAVENSTDTLYTVAVTKWNANYGRLLINFKGAPNTTYTVKVGKTVDSFKDYTITTDANGVSVWSTYHSGVTQYVAQAPEGVVVESAQHAPNANEYNAQEAFVFGSLYALVWSNLSGSNSWGNGFGSVRWYTGNKGWGGNGFNNNAFVSEERTFVGGRDTVVAMDVLKTPVTLTAGESANYTVSYKIAGYSAFSSTATSTDENSTKDGNKGTGLLTNSKFKIMENLPGTAYALRIYDRALTADEKALNHFVDIMAYLRYDIAKYEALSAETKAALIASFADTELGGVKADNIDKEIARIENTNAIDDTLYVQDGLVALFVADQSLDIANKVWYNMVDGGANATLAGSRFYANVDGSLRINGTRYGTRYADGYVDNNSFGGTKIGQDYSASGHYLDVGIANLPDEDFTVQMTASYEHITWMDIRTGLPAQRTGRVAYSEGGYRFSIGYFTAWCNLTGSYGTHRLTYGGASAIWQGGYSWDSDRANFANKVGTGVYTETITRDEADDNLSGAYKWYQGTAEQASWSYTSTGGKNPADSGYKADESAGKFILFQGWPVNVYSVAVYDRVLSATEMQQNHAADLVEYYNIDTKVLLAKGNEGLLTAFISAAQSIKIDPDNYLENKATLEQIAVPQGEMNDYDKLYVQNGLTALYTAYDLDDKSIDYGNGVWYNKLGANATQGAVAVLRGPKYDANVADSWGWTKGANGGFHVSITKTIYDKYISGKATESGSYTGILLDKGLIEGDVYTVEAVMEHEYLLTASGAPYECSADNNKWGVYNGSGAAYRLGSWNSTSFWAKPAAGHTSSSFGQDRWFYFNGVYTAHNGNAYAKNWMSHRNKIGIDDIYSLSLVHEMVDATKTETVEGVETTVNFSASKLTARYDIDSTVGSATATVEKLPAYGEFSLLNGIGGAVYAVRTYNRALSIAEMEQNHFADLAAYLKLDLTEFNKLDDDQKLQVYTEYANTRLNGASKANIEAYIATLSGGVLADTLYVTEGLVGMFSAFAADKGDFVNLAGKSWINLVDPEVNATIEGSTWKMNADGSIGYDMNWGTAVPKTDYFGKVWYDRDSSTSNHNMDNHYVNFGIDLLPADNFTVEWVSKYDEVGLTLADGSQVSYLLSNINKYYYTKTEIATGNKTGVVSDTALTDDETYTYTLLGYGYAAANSYINPSLADAIGYLKTFASVGGRFEGNTNYCYRWYTTDGNGGWNSSGYKTPDGSTNFWEDKGGVYSTIPGEIQTKTVTRTKNYESDVLTSVKYDILRNGTLTSSATYPVEATHTPGKSYPLGAETHFYLFKGQPVDLYAVRIYSRVLSAEEQIQNRAADIVKFYDVDLTKFYQCTAIEQAEILSELADIGFDSTKEQAQKVADYVPAVEANGRTQYDEAYVQNGLVGLYTAYALNETSLSIQGGTWANKVEDGEAATVVGTGYWFRGENGGLGYHLTFDQYVSFAQSNNAGIVGISLPESFADLDAFTVESVAKTYGATNKDGSIYYNIRTNEYVDENGITVPATGAIYGYFGQYSAGYRFGLLNSLSWGVQYPGNENSLGNNRWYVSPYRYGHHNGNQDKASVYAAIGQEKTLQNYNLEAITFQVGKTTAENGDVTYKIGANGAAPSLTGTVTAAKLAELEALDPTTAPDKAGKFSLYNNIPSMVYAVRVYNRELSQAEQYQNHFVDIAAYYGLDLSLMKDEDKELLYASFENISFAADADYVKALYAFLTGDKLAMADSVAAHGGYAPLEKDAGYRVLFELDEDTLSRFEDAGYKVSYGAIVGVGTYGANTVNTVDSLTINLASNGAITTSASNAQIVLVGGENGTGVYYDVVGEKTIFSVAVSADPAQYSAGIIVRGFVTFVDATGATKVVYLDASEDAALGGEVSVLDAADYFVNEYADNVVLAYQYMGNPVLRNVLNVCGIPARNVIDGELNIYVDAANGSDEDEEGRGLSADKAFATVEAAYAAMKAHLQSKNAKGVNLILGEGEYNVQKVLALKGTDINSSDYYINIQGAGADKTVLTGEVAIDTSKATVDPDTGLYVVGVPQVNGAYPKFRYVYANGEILQNVHIGDEENYYTIGTPVVNDTAKTAKIYMPSDLFDGFSTYENTEVHITVEWNFNIIHIVEVDYDDTDANDDVAVYVNYDQYKNMAVYNTVAGRQFWLENSYDLIAAGAANFTLEESCYFYDEEGTLYFYDAEGNFANTEFTYAGVENMFTFDGVSNLSIRDLTITGVDNRYVTDESGLKGGQAGSNGRIVNNDTGNAVTESRGFLTLAAIYANNVSNATFSGLRIEKVGGDGINLRGAVVDVDIISNEFLHIGETAIRIGNSSRGETSIASGNYNKNITVADNYINGTGEYFKQCCGMLITNGANIKVVGNTITNTTYTAISIGWKWNESTLTLEQIKKNNTFHLYNVEVAYNYITNFMTCMRDGGGIYILGGNAANDEATYFNYMHDNYMVVTEASGNHVTPKWFMGYYHDGAGSNWHDYNNVIVNATTTGVGNLVPYYVQQIDGQKAHNVKLEGNYALGFASATALYGNTARIDASRNISANDYIFSDVAMNTPVVGSACGAAVSVAAPSNAKALVANIYATAGSALAPVNVKLAGGVSVAGGTANEKVYAIDGEIVNSGDLTGGMAAPTYAVNVIVDGVTVKTYNIVAGETLTIDVADPTKAADVQYTYTFAGWNGYEAGMKVYSNMDIEAVFDKTVNEYKVTFMNGNEVFYEVDAPYGTALEDVIAGIVNVPTKEADKVNTYTFKAWFTTNDDATGLPAIGQTVDGDKTYHATFSKQVIKYYFSLVVYNPATEEYETLTSGYNNYNSVAQVRDLDKYTYYVGNYQTPEEIAIVDQFVADYKPADTENVKYAYNMTVVVKEGGSENAYFHYAYNSGSVDYNLWNAWTDVDGTVFELVFDESEYRVNVNGEDLWYAKGATIDFTALDPDKEIESITVNGEALDAADYTAYTVDVAGADIVINYVAEAEYAIGDVDGDGELSAGDAVWIYQVIAGTRTVAELFGEADIDGDGELSAGDVVWLYQIIAGTRDGVTLEPIA